MATADELTKALDAFYERSIRPQFERMDGRLGRVEEHLGQIDVRLGRLEGRVERLAAETARRFEDVTDRIDKVQEGLEAFRLLTDGRLGDLYGKFQGLQDEYHLIASALGRLEDEGGPAKRAEVERLNGRLDQVERRLGEIEARITRAPDR